MNINVLPKEGEELQLEILAEHIQKIADLGAAISASRLRQRTIILLLHELTKVKKTDIEKILEAMPMLERNFLKPVSNTKGQ